MPKTFACGMLVSALNPISIFTDPEQVSEIKPQDIQVLMNYIYANPSMKNGGETWTPICLPGINAYLSSLFHNQFWNFNCLYWPKQFLWVQGESRRIISSYLRLWTRRKIKLYNRSSRQMYNSNVYAFQYERTIISNNKK